MVSICDISETISAPTTQDAKLVGQTQLNGLGNRWRHLRNRRDATLTAQADTGVNFIRWEDSSGNNLGTSPTLITTISGDSTITAIFEEEFGNSLNFYSIHTNVDPFGSGTITGGGAHLAGSTVVLTAIPAEGLDFAGWAGDASGTSNTINIIVDSDKTVSAYFGQTSKDSDTDGLSDLYERSLGYCNSDPTGMVLRMVRGQHLRIPQKSIRIDGYDDKTEANNGTVFNDANDFPFIASKVWYATSLRARHNNSPNKSMWMV